MEREQPLVTIEQFIATDYHARAFDLARRGKPIPPLLLVRLAMAGLFAEPVMHFVRYAPGPVGLQLRRWWAKARLRRFGANSLIDRGVTIEGPQHISVADYVWIDRDVRLHAAFGEIVIGHRVHVAPGVSIAGGGGVYIGDYAGIGANAHILSHSEATSA